MIHWPELVPFVTLGLLGSLHCAGMCGGFALAVAGAGHGVSPWPVLSRQATYVVGKATAYAVLGLVLATGTHWLGDAAGGVRTDGFATFQRVLGWLAGAILVSMGLAAIGVRVPRPRGWERSWARVVGLLRPLFDGVRALPGPAGAFGTGVLNGMLPCGLSWSAFLLATQSAPPTAALGAFAFGLATGPVLVAVGIAPRFVSVAARRSARPLLGGALVVFGCLTLVRAGDTARGGHAACCVEAADLEAP